MTEQKQHSAIVDETASSAEAPSAAGKEKTAKGTALGALAIVIALALSGGLYLYQRQLAQQQAKENQALRDQLNSLQQQAQSEKQTLTGQLTRTDGTLQNLHQQQAASAKELDELRQKVTSITGSDVRTWMISQADYLVKLAGRKLWSDQDVTTAGALLKSADETLADMNDPSTIEVRRALTQDISTLSAISQVDYDGIILKLNQLSNNIDNLPLADNNDNEAPMDADSNELSSSLHQWRQNLVKSWHTFMDNFITIRRRDNTAQPLLAPDQQIYLRENIRSRLLIAAQAVPRHQDEIYKQSLDTVSAWIRAWYDVKNPAVKAFLAQLDELSQENISVDLPVSLQSQRLMDKLMETRVRNLLAQPAAANPQAPQPQQGE
ncbi:uroporphyrinogen-III C-methyltransferase [Erwinia sp. OLTSP20]|uniref:uroporphyrinogen-III C-methyltransferase n=1 Tax=unclassified Erwinia TaxID=2622719 RepID=UPI000C17DCF9|nr:MULTISPECIES: uroporphyrinogen-III C-methyltransferase [unclassified Erwinia]PIJ50776.1 uroporphyrinogen-III C-methyltransferase [Erwinia sp. OAMSP11]PIJ72928.1 uroporphyrinogen-III C-methyltransferase [Erwinia sp. OLSSP12]PIJ81943.1 uroporphyrinogen-III C-methyltransferase [Erwinia sp. OLCASP19]PIJ84598.1 uroporphyrinogen-III C-methyltransferase [Erwinia sp. OLMTSP26]PIJ86945.1 uroporphyrinogen-III C-methyltransferase [Erwinia sp. OLMDSP33]